MERLANARAIHFDVEASPFAAFYSLSPFRLLAESRKGDILAYRACYRKNDDEYDSKSTMTATMKTKTRKKMTRERIRFML